MDGKPLKGHYPAPYFDSEGELWTYDPEFGWKSSKQWKELYERSFPKSSSLRRVGRMVVFGTGGSLEEKGDFKSMFYNQWEETK
jgi:hypothetical protein